MTDTTRTSLVETPYWSEPVALAVLISETLDWASRNLDCAQPILDAIQDVLLRGSGIDIGTSITVWEDVHRGKLASDTPESSFRLFASWHAMDSNGYYAGWFDFAVWVTSTFAGPVVALEWLTPNGQSPEELSEDEYAEANADSDEWFGVSDPTDYLIDTYSYAMREGHARSEFDTPPA